MSPLKGAVFACALGTLATAACSARADQDNVYRKCFFHHCRKRPCCPEPVCAYAPPACPPVTVRYRRCGPIRRLLGRCCRVPPSPCPPPCPPAPCVPAPVVVPALPAPPPAPVYYPPAPPPSYRVAPPPQVDPNSAPPPAPPVMGSKYQPVRPGTPVYPQQVRPAAPTPPVRLDHFASFQKRQ